MLQYNASTPEKFIIPRNSMQISCLRSGKETKKRGKNISPHTTTMNKLNRIKNQYAARKHFFKKIVLIR